jgi:translation initiation factor 4G
MSTEEIDSLVGKIEVYGEPRITPKMKLDKAFAQLDEEAAQA